MFLGRSLGFDETSASSELSCTAAGGGVHTKDERGRAKFSVSEACDAANPDRKICYTRLPCSQDGQGDNRRRAARHWLIIMSASIFGLQHHFFRGFRRKLLHKIR
jgi:hypothetical protein